MRKLGLLLVLLVGCSAWADGIALTSTLITFTDCSSGGSSAQTVPEGTYLLTVTTEDVWMCRADTASTCATLGTKLPAGTALLYTVGRGGASLSCRSSASTGDLQLTKV